MSKLPENASAEQVRLFLSFLEVRLHGRAVAAEVRNDVKEARTRLRMESDAYEDAVNNRMAATAEVNYLDGVLDEAVSRLVKKVEHAVDGDREDSRFIHAFPSAPSAATKDVASDAQRTYVRAAIAALRADASLIAVAPYVDAVDTAQNDLDAAVAARDALYVAEQQAGARLAAATHHGRDVHNGARPRLEVIYPKQDALVKSFFRKR